MTTFSFLTFLLETGAEEQEEASHLAFGSY